MSWESVTETFTTAYEYEVSYVNTVWQREVGTVASAQQVGAVFVLQD